MKSPGSAPVLVVVLLAVLAAIFGTKDINVVDLIRDVKSHPIAAQTATDDSPSRPTARTSAQYLGNRGYETGYCNSLRNPLWVRYVLDRNNISQERFRRPDSGFFPDSRTVNGASPDAFRGSDYQRGHMAPSFAIGKFAGREAQLETFLMSNISPQRSESNEGVWNSIERMEADDFALRFGRIEVVCGPVFTEPIPRMATGVAVPAGHFKAIRRPDGQMIAFVVPQLPTDRNPVSCLRSIDEITRLTGVDPFPDANPHEKQRLRNRIW